MNLGAGLDTRFHRLNNGRVKWIELDLPDVIAFRRKLHEPEINRHRMIAASVLDDDWVMKSKQYAKGRILFVAEGLFMYFTEEEHRKIFTCLAEKFPGQEMVFHTMAPSLIQGLGQYSLVSKARMKVEMQWGLGDSKQVSALNPKVEFVDEFSLLDGWYDELPEPVRQKLSPAMARAVAKIVHVRFHA